MITLPAPITGLKLKHKVVALISFLAIVPVVGAIVSYNTLTTQEKAQELALKALSGQAYLERVNGLIYAVAMDARGIYMAEDAAVALKFSERIQEGKAGLQTAMDNWRGTIVDDKRALFEDAEKAINDFVTHRVEMVRLLREVSLDAARRFGDTETSRRGREALNAKMREVSAEYDAYVASAIAASDRARSAAFNTAVMTGLVSVVALALGIWLVIQNLARPVERMTRSILDVASGRTDIEIYGIGRQDEIGEMAGAVEVFKQNLLETERLRTEQIERDRQAAAARKAEMARLADQFQESVGRIVETVSSASSQLETAAGQLTVNAASTQELSGTVASASEQTSVNVQGVAAASEQLSMTVQEIGRQVHESSGIAEEAVHQASETNANVVELAESAERIGAVVELINQIAGQTNLLALNATIEAARAGDAGKGFAVVAQEVKALAAQTAKATSDIGNQILSMQNSTRNTVEAINRIAATINRISTVSGAIAAAVEQQGAATNEISRNVQNAAEGTTSVTSNMGELANAVAETNASADMVLVASVDVGEKTRQLRGQIDRFLSDVAAA